MHLIALTRFQLFEIVITLMPGVIKGSKLMPCIVLKHAKGVKCYLSSEDVMTITYKIALIGNIFKTFWASFSPFSIGILSTGQKGVSTVAIFAIVATLSRQSVDNSSSNWE